MSTQISSDNLIDFAKPYRNKRVLVTGGSGYLGHNLVNALSRTRCSITRLFLESDSKPAKPLKVEAEIKDVGCDIREPNLWDDILKDVDFVFHLAAQTSVYKANQDPLADMQINVMPMLHMLEVCRQKKYKPAIIFAGTSTEVGIPVNLPVSEDFPDNPLTFYDIHKLAAEKYLIAYARNGIARGVTLRLTNVYGPGPKSSSAERGVLNMMVRKALKGEVLTVYGDGEHIRDYVFVDDIVKAFLKAGEKIDRISGDYYVIGSGRGHRISEAINLVAQRTALKTGKRPKVAHVSPPQETSPIESRDFVADISKFKQKTGWFPGISLQEGIDRTIEWYKKRGEQNEC